MKVLWNNGPRICVISIFVANRNLWQPSLDRKSVVYGNSVELSHRCSIQRDDGIRVFHVTGVQTCALPISEFSPLYCLDNGRPAKPIRLMVGLLILKHIRNISDESIVEQWSENLCYQYFCGQQEFMATVP